MPPEEEKSSWLETVADGGLPQIIAGPAGKAVSRLIGVAVEIPVAYIDGFAQSIKDKTTAKSKVTQVMGEKAAEMAVADAELMDRARNCFLGRQFRSQKNKDEIVKIAIEDLKADPPSHDSEGPSDDWLNKFERHAEDASSDDLRLMYAKLLAGEIRYSGTVSAATLHFVSMLDGEVSKLIERVLPFTIFDGHSHGGCFVGAITPSLSHVEVTILEQSGFWTSGNERTFPFDGDGVFELALRSNLGIRSIAAPNQEITLEMALVSNAGSDLARTIDRDFATKAFAESLFKKGVTKCIAGNARKDELGRMKLQNPIEFLPPKTPST